MQLTYRLSYAMNSTLGRRDRDRPKTSDIKRPGITVLLTDAGNDNVSQPDEMEWDFDDEPDYYGPILEVHHHNGNNFLFADLHVEYWKIIPGLWHDGVPPYPRCWLP